jgi:spermidine/putrescine transport system ATP-binding protein
MIEGAISAVESGLVAVTTKVGVLKIASLDAESLSVGDAVLVSIRPEHFLTGGVETGAQPLGEAVIEEISFQGTYHEARMRHLSDAQFRPTMLLPQSTAAVPGDKLALFVRPDTPVILRA